MTFNKFVLSNKTVLMFSPQAWGKMFISKHHYALELAKRGNRVYFVNPPLNKNIFKVSQLKEYPGIYLIDSGLPFLRDLRFHSSLIFSLYNRLNLKRIEKSIKDEIDLIWSFDFFGFCDFSFFKKAYKIAHPVDFVLSKEIKNAKNADILFSVADKIIEDFSCLKIPSYFINHSVSEEFISNLSSKKTLNSGIKFGYIGNLLRPDIDYKNIIAIVEQCELVEFTFIGSFKKSNIGASNEISLDQSISYLRNLSNVTFTGILDKKQMALKMSEMDGFFIAYDKSKDMCKGANYHKVLEYLATGKVIVSNYVSAYKEIDLFPMVIESADSDSIIDLFEEVVNSINSYNSIEFQNSRINFALDNTYSKQVDRIENILNKV
jgi:glycosyltransferase involved in cell wall biosynthesis